MPLTRFFPGAYHAVTGDERTNADSPERITRGRDHDGCRAVSAAAQQTYPNRPVQLVVPVPPGGAADFIARTVSAKLADAIGQPVVINNQGGAGGTIASRGVARPTLTATRCC